MRRTLVLLLVLLLAAGLAGCGKRTPESATPTDAPSSAETSETDADTAEVAAGVALADVDVPGILGVRTEFAEATAEDTDAGLEAVATAQLAEGEKADEGAVLALLGALAERAPETGSARVELWIPGTPDARFAQYLWSREQATLERFEASIPAEEFAVYKPVGAEESEVEPEGFEASRTGVIEGVDLKALKALASQTPPWKSETP